MKSILELKNLYKGKDIWILASGPSLNFVEPSFFKNKITIGVNRICEFFECDYIVAKDPTGLEKILEHKTEKTKIILSKYSTGLNGKELNKIKGDFFIFSHLLNSEAIDFSVVKKKSNRIVVSQSTITSAIHMAAFMGAKNIIICGHDCGSIDGYSNINGYYKNLSPVQKTTPGYLRWLSNIEKNTRDVSDAISKEFGCNIYSLNPFLNLNATGHKYVSANNYLKKFPIFFIKSFIKTIVLISKRKLKLFFKNFKYR